jgi:hypothetical protein
MNISYTILLSNHLYLDPGSGSILIQIVLAALLSIGLVLRLSWRRIKGFITRKPMQSDDSARDDLEDL